MDNKIQELLSKKLQESKVYYHDEKNQFTQVSNSDEMKVLSLETNPGGIVTMKTVLKVDAPFEKLIKALSDVQYLKSQTPNLEEWRVVESNDSYQIHYYKTGAKTDIIFGEVKERSEGLYVFAGASVDYPSITLEEGRTITYQYLNSTIVKKINDNQSELTYIMSQNITRFDAQVNNKVLLESIPPFLLTLSKGFASYPN